MTQKPGPIHAFFDSLRNRLIVKIFLPIAFILFSSIFLWSWFSLESQEQKTTIQSLTQGADRVASTVQLGLHYAMRLNSREDTQHIVANYGKLKEIRGIRIINKSGEVMFDSDPEKTHALIPQKDPLCQACHQGQAPKLDPSLAERIYMDSEKNGERVLRLASPILNEPGCSDPAGCHFHRADEKVLGVLDLGFSLADMDSIIQENRRHTLSLAFVQFAVTFATLAALFLILIKRPIARLIGDIKQIAQGKTLTRRSVMSHDEIGQLAEAIYQMGEDLTVKNDQLSLQKNLY